MEQRADFKKEMDSSKRQIMGQFEMVKSGKLDASVLAAEYGIDASKFQGNNSMNKSSMYNTSQNKSKPSNLRPKSSQRESVNKRKDSEIIHHDDSHLRPQESQRSNTKNNLNKKALEELKLEQNHEMLLVLEDEQNNEANREETLMKLNDQKEKKRLEKVYGSERAKAQSRIQELASFYL